MLVKAKYVMSIYVMLGQVRALYVRLGQDRSC